ncbi:MAG: hypothetical protein HZB65_01085 [Candidatus Aenigmarchaeota archaeon]|nr:hypothetical protein [Candidatus Aenigmarchaeota archaeon]
MVCARSIGLMFVMAVILGASIGYAQVSEYSTVYDIQPDFSVKESIYVKFENPLNQSIINYTLDREVSDIYVSGNGRKLDTELAQSSGRYLLRIHATEPMAELAILFRINDYVYSSGGKNVFFASLDLENDAKNASISLILPEGYGIIDNRILPEPASVSTDGRRINITWMFTGNSFSGSAAFESLNKEFNAFIPAVIILAIVIILVYIKLRKKAKTDFYKGLSEDELKTIKKKKKNPQTYQNKIEQEFKFSRAKMTRIIQKLEVKQLLEKKRKGRTNRLIWKK